jgi:hypothetical protein
MAQSKGDSRLISSFRASPMRFQPSLYRLQHLMRPRQTTMIPETQNAIPLRFQIARARRVVSYGVRMLAAIEFDHQFEGGRGEIHDIRADRFLPMKFHLRETLSSQPVPKPSLRIRRMGSQDLGLLTQIFVHVFVPRHVRCRVFYLFCGFAAGKGVVFCGKAAKTSMWRKATEIRDHHAVLRTGENNALSRPCRATLPRRAGEGKAGSSDT